MSKMMTKKEYKELIGESWLAGYMNDQWLDLTSDELEKFETKAWELSRQYADLVTSKEEVKYE